MPHNVEVVGWIAAGCWPEHGKGKAAVKADHRAKLKDGEDGVCMKAIVLLPMKMHHLLPELGYFIWYPAY